MKNQMFLDQAMQLVPKLHRTKVPAAGCVVPKQDEQGKITMTSPEDYRSRQLRRGDSVILDFSDHQVGYLTLTLGTCGSHADAPVLLKLHFAEQPAELFEDPQQYHGWVCASWVEEERIHVDVLPGKTELPRRYAFRYVKVEVLEISSKFALVIKDACCAAVSSARDEDLLPYSTSNPLYRKLDRIACRTLHNCMQKVFEDGPKRDRRLWMGDLRLQALANYETYQANDLVRECLYLFAALPSPNGQVSACVFMEPEPEADDVVMFDYSLLFVNALLDYYTAAKDMKTVRELWPTALSQIYLAEAALTEQDLVREGDQPGWCFIDWNLELNKQGSAQGVFLYALRAGIELAQICGDEKEAEKLTDIYRSIRSAANRLLWDEEEGCYVSGAGRQISMATQVWMVLGGAAQGKEAAQLLKTVRQRKDAAGMVSPYMMHYYIEALLCAGEEDLAMEELCTYWGGMAERGADTFWELYNPENPDESPYGGTIVNSYCHAWSCGPAYFLRRYQGSETYE